MNRIHLVVHDGIWRLEKYEGAGMDLVGIFLASDVTWNAANRFRTWLETNHLWFVEGNFCFLVKDRQNKKVVKINCKYAPDFDATAVALPIQAIIDLLQQWEDICNQNDTVITGVDIQFDGATFNCVVVKKAA